MFRRRKHPREWSPDQWKRQIRACFTSDPDREEVKASVIVHWDLDLLPKDTVEEARRDVEADGEEWTGFREYACFQFGFEDDDRVDLFMDGNMTVCVRGMLQDHTLEEAKAAVSQPDFHGDRVGWIPRSHQSA